MSSSAVLLDHWRGLAFSLVVSFLSIKIYKFTKHRHLYKNLPTPPHSLILGNLAVMGEHVKKYPADAHPQVIFTNLGLEQNLEGIYYMDLSPFSPSLILISDPVLGLQIQTSPLYHRHPFAVAFLGGIVGSKSLFSTLGAEWSKQRSWFAPAFSLQHILTLVPGMVEEILVFRKHLERLAESGDIFSMNEYAMRLTIDIIGRSVGDIKLNSQSGQSEVMDAFSSAVGWTAGITDSFAKQILSPGMMWWYIRKLDKSLGGMIVDKFKEAKVGWGGKTILDLAWKGYCKETGIDGKVARAENDRNFMKIALDNAKVFFAGGHDTTASLVTYTFHYLSLHPSILSRVREEHNSIFGLSLESTLTGLHSDPHLLNKLPLTNAVHKEVLRLHATGFTVREAVPGTKATYKGREYPMDGHMICMLASAMQRNDDYFANPHVFDPDRWLIAANSSTDEGLSNGAWQPFEKGPRNCIGQQLALIEARTIAVLILRWFDFEANFKEGTGSIEGWGGQAYQEVKLTAKPKDGIPMEVRKRRNEEEEGS